MDPTRDPWMLDRAHYQPLDQVATFVDGHSLQGQAAAGANDLPDLLRRMRDVVRPGRVLRLGAEEIVLEDATVHTDNSQVHVNRTAMGLRLASARPFFEPGRIILQRVRQIQLSLNAALVTVVEAYHDDDVERNRL